MSAGLTRVCDGFCSDMPTLRRWRVLAQRHGDRIAVHDPHHEPVVELSYRCAASMEWLQTTRRVPAHDVTTDIVSF